MRIGAPAEPEPCGLSWPVEARAGLEQQAVTGLEDLAVDAIEGLPGCGGGAPVAGIVAGGTVEEVVGRQGGGRQGDEGQDTGQEPVAHVFRVAKYPARDGTTRS